MEAQTRMRKSKILVVNAGALANEIIKNLVLAGIGSLTVLDNHIVEGSDLGAQFFISDQDIGKNRAEAALPAIKKLNPRVITETVAFPIESKGPDWYSQFDAIVGTQLSYPEILHIDTSIRSSENPSGTTFFAASIAGFYGSLFADFGPNFIFTTEQERSNMNLLKVGPESRTTNILSVSPATRKDGKRVFDTYVKSQAYITFDHLVGADDVEILGISGTNRARKANPLAPIVLGYWELQKSSNGSEITQSQLKEAALSQVKRLKLRESIILDYNEAETDGDELIETYLSSQGAEISPIAAILGGVVGQQVLNTISKKAEPIRNLLVFNGLDSKSAIYSFV